MDITHWLLEIVRTIEDMFESLFNDLYGVLSDHPWLAFVLLVVLALLVCLPRKRASRRRCIDLM